jgi:hypothetical protein
MMTDGSNARQPFRVYGALIDSTELFELDVLG